MLDSCPAQVALLLHDAMVHFTGTQLTVGTACSGTDLIMATFQSLTSLFKGLNIEVRFEHLFAADINGTCRQFVMANWDPKARRAAPL